ncbi:MAG: sugar phosphate isomerase/epimerase, partial [Acidobacteria bacterium]|nr:sugar phosphate isomerase/epimerase [Acidobacteriota bacterium]
MTKLSYIIVELPDSFGSFDNFAAALRRVKELGYHGVEFNLTRPAGFEVEKLARFVEAIDLRVVSFLTGANYFGEGLCLSSPRTEVRLRAVERLQEYTQIAARFGAVLVVGQMQGFLSDELNR